MLHLLRQSVQPEEIIVIDNASSDNSLAGCRSLPKVKVISAEENFGFAKGNNLALAICTSSYVALLNPDAFPEPQWLESLLKSAADHPAVAAFGSRQLSCTKDDVLDGIADCYHVSGLVWRDRHGAIQQSEDLSRKEIFSPCAAAALYRRQAIVDVGGFDEDYFCYVEDVDLGFRLRLAGHKAMYVPEAVVRHVGAATSGGQRSGFSVYHGHRNLVWTFVKNMPGILFWALLPLHAALNVLTMTYFIFRGQGGVILRAKHDAIKELPAMWRKRREIQAKRVATVGEIWRVLNKRLWPRL